MRPDMRVHHRGGMPVLRVAAATDLQEPQDAPHVPVLTPATRKVLVMSLPNFTAEAACYPGGGYRRAPSAKPGPGASITPAGSTILVTDGEDIWCCEPCGSARGGLHLWCCGDEPCGSASGPASGFPATILRA